MKLILDTLERARLAASPAEADALRVALIDLEALADALGRNGWTLDDAPPALDDFAAVVNHVAAQPFDVTEADDHVDVPQITETTPGSFTEWLATLEGLAQ